ncbi:MAG: hypothetical protein JW702_09540 [Clostridiales bacterium]|nr:hypothetical protein [Clostridiales bacterium]
MIKKSAFIIALLVLISTSSFADADFNRKIEVVSPTIGVSGDVVIVNNLYISVRIDEVVESQIKLVKIEEYDVEMGVLDKVFLNIELTDEEESQIYGANVARVYFSLKNKLFDLQNQYNQMNTFVENVDENEIELLQKEMQNISQQLMTYRNEYEALFYKTVVGPEPLMYEGILPYYEKTVPDVADGNYKLIFESSKGLLQKEVAFSVKSKESVVNEIVKSIPLRLIKMMDYME